MRFEISHEVASLGAVSEDDRPDAEAHSKHLMQLILNWLDELDEPYRTLILLREIQELPYNEIAQTMDLPLNTTKVYIHRARRRLRDLLPEEIGNEI